MLTDSRRHAPATLRNREPICDTLQGTLPARGLVLEVASGTGEHVGYFAERLTALTWQPSDADPAAIASIEGHRGVSGLANILPAIVLDAAAEDWPVTTADAVVCINMIHIAPWNCCVGLLRGGARILPPDGPLVIYGPFMREGRHTAPSNAAFDRSLRANDPEWGVRDLDVVGRTAAAQGLRLDDVIEMPANNLTVVLRKH